MKMIFMILGLIYQFSFADVGFQGDYKSQSLYGDVIVYCHDVRNGFSSSHFNCAENHLVPYEYAYFYGPEKIDADQFELVATWENGKGKKKSGDYSSKKGRSDSTINLWIETLFQSPLLNLGKNKIHYKLSKKHTVVAEGDFDLIVNNSPALHCPTRSLTSYDENDCRSPFNACSQYFNTFISLCSK